MNPTTSAATITLELTGPLQRAVGTEWVQLPVAAPPRLGDLLAALVTQYPEAESHLAPPDELRRSGPLPAGFLVVRQSAALPARLETPVDAGDRLTLLSIISGG